MPAFAGMTERNLRYHDANPLRSDDAEEDSMKSAYGRQVPRPDYELTCVEGSLMVNSRPAHRTVCTSDELRDLPRKEKRPRGDRRLS